MKKIDLLENDTKGGKGFLQGLVDALSFRISYALERVVGRASSPQSIPTSEPTFGRISVPAIVNHYRTIDRLSLDDIQTIQLLLDALKRPNDSNPFALKSIKDIYFGTVSQGGIKGNPEGRGMLLSLKHVLQLIVTDTVDDNMSDEEMHNNIGKYTSLQGLRDNASEIISYINILEENDETPQKVYTQDVYENSPHDEDAVKIGTGDDSFSRKIDRVYSLVAYYFHREMGKKLKPTL